MMVFALAAALAVSPSPVCGNLAVEYEAVSKAMSRITAEGLSDDSAPRLTLRELRKQTEMQKAGVIVQLMQAHHCEAPASAPSQYRYVEKITECAKAGKLDKDDSPECKF